MNKLKVIIFLMVFQYGLGQQDLVKKRAKMIPEVDNKFEKFDIETFNKENIRGKRIEKKQDYFVEEDQQSSGYAYQLYPNSSSFSILKLFFQNQNIKKKGVVFNNGSEYGIWYEFDEQGNQINEMDTDKGYDFDWNQVIRYCEKHKIRLTKGYVDSGFQTTIYKEVNDKGSKIWVITYQISGDLLVELTLDGKTGTVLKEKKLEFINH